MLPLGQTIDDGKGQSNLFATTSTFQNKSRKICLDTNTQYRIFRSNSTSDSSNTVVYKQRNNENKTSYAGNCTMHVWY